MPEGKPPSEPGVLARLFRRGAESPAPAAPVKTKRASISQDDRLLDLLNRARRGPDGLLSPDRVKELSARVMEIASTDTRLAAFPSTALQVVEAAQQNTPNDAELIRLINQDAALTAHLLRIANSAYYHRGNEVTTIREAVTRLGFRDLADVACSAAAVALLTDPLQEAGAAFVAQRRQLAVHYLACALGASWYAMEQHRNSQRAYLDGLLHDVGKGRALMALATLCTNGELLPSEVDAAIPLVLEATHIELGVSMAKAWKLPEHVVVACAQHHGAAEGIKGIPIEGWSNGGELHMLRLTSGMVQLCLTTWRQVILEQEQEVDACAAHLGMDRPQLTAALTQVQDFVAKAVAMIDASWMPGSPTTGP